ncbi:NTF2-like N-terminal transpeptidase domain-containing protein [Clostridioides difficile]|uniref:NTF2-like N-terminal transpeptidase domain-containing protein n=1 Tax=Clostridioides difficile TaxID=1496 RepID=UPI002562E2D3|nr:NTF2-like N-terminal transpeptidase domain-containing protein [Clostridioides difficile]GMK84618.1 hypothetical protein JSCD7_30020 [Clostridioides difficile]
MNITKRMTLLLTLLIVILITGCSPKESASEVAKKYIDKMNSGDYETAYSLLSKDSKKKISLETVSLTHLRAHETCEDLVGRLLLEKKKKNKTPYSREVQIQPLLL